MKLRLTRTRIAVAAVGVAAVVGGGASIAAASSDGTTTSAESADDAGHADGESADGPDGGPGSEHEADDPTFTGSVPAPAEAEVPDGQENGGSDAAEQAALAAAATVTTAQAEQAALAAVPGTVATTELDTEDGFVVYSVEVNGAGGTVTEVTVDAGDGAVLAQQTQDPSDPQD